jgi:hypothetical protein
VNIFESRDYYWEREKCLGMRTLQMKRVSKFTPKVRTGRVQPLLKIKIQKENTDYADTDQTFYVIYPSAEISH